MMKTFSKHLRYPLWLAAIVLAFWWLMFGYKYQFIYNHGVSMQPTYENGEWIVMEKRSYLGKKWLPERFDCVIIEDKKTKEDLTKRVIGLPGDTIEVRAGLIYLNKKELKDPFGRGKILVYIVDDNDNNLRYWEGPEAGEPVIELISHKEEKIPEGYVWVIGDNRSESWYGLLQLKDVKGLVVL